MAQPLQGSITSRVPLTCLCSIYTSLHSSCQRSCGTEGRGGVPDFLITGKFLLVHLVCKVKHLGDRGCRDERHRPCIQRGFLTGHTVHPSHHSCEAAAFTAIFMMRKTEIRVLPSVCSISSVVSNSVQPHRQQPTRLRHPWDSPGKNTGVGCHFLLQCMKVKSESEVVQSCPTLHDPMDCSLPGSSIHGIFQARVLEWVAIALSLEFAK